MLQGRFVPVPYLSSVCLLYKCSLHISSSNHNPDDIVLVLYYKLRIQFVPNFFLLDSWDNNYVGQTFFLDRFKNYIAILDIIIMSICM